MTSPQNVTFPSNGRTAHGYLAVPEAGDGPGLIIIQEWWGLDDHIVDVADRFAREGFVALAPDLYDGQVTHDEQEAIRLMQQLPPAQAVADLSGAVDYLLGQPQAIGDAVGVVGFCFGGGFVLRLAARAGAKVAAAVVFYGAVNPGEDLSGIRAAVQGHFGEQDQSIPPQRAREELDQIRQQTGVPVEVYSYDAGHAFANDLNLIGTHDPDATELAWARSLHFLRTHLAAG
ncbi:MAG: dienelactone hydrolase family protein [Streptosporangiaceae bacterium]|nr:dienelactone hydrolase family protein [Streptosporangiaceae bacterium]